MTRRATAVLLVGAVSLSACAQGVGGPPQAWIDTPLNGWTLLLGPMEVVSHASDLSGISTVEFSVNGAVVASGPPEDGTATLVTSRFYWQADQEGTFTLQVRGQGNSGAWSEYATVVITVSDATPTPTATPTSPDTPTPTATATPTNTPTRTPAPTFTPTRTPAPDTQPPSVSVGHSPASPYNNDLITITANASDNQGVVIMEIIFGPAGTRLPIVKTCTNTTSCIFQGGPYMQGPYEYYARAFDAAGNNARTPTQLLTVVPYVAMTNEVGVAYGQQPESGSGRGPFHARGGDPVQRRAA